MEREWKNVFGVIVSAHARRPNTKVFIRSWAAQPLRCNTPVGRTTDAISQLVVGPQSRVTEDGLDTVADCIIGI
jgi:hypothetical protein